MPETRTNYIDLTTLKIALGFERNEDSSSDDQLRNIIEAANAEVDSLVKPHLGEAPITPGTPIFVQIKRTAIRLAESLWYERMSQLTRAEHSNKMYEQKLEALIKSIIADKPDRTQTILITGNDPFDGIKEPSRVDEYITREF